MTVYADVLVVVNYLINLLLLLATGKILGFQCRRKRLCLSSLLGAAGSLIIFLPSGGMIFQILLKFTLAAAMTFAAFGYHSGRRFAKAFAVFFAVSFVFAGAIMALQLLFSPAGILYYNGIIYFDISALQLLFWTAVAYTLLLLIERMLSSRVEEKKLYDLTIYKNGHSIVTKGLCDNGNTLKEPFSGTPVIVCDRELTEKIYPLDDRDLRMIPCTTVAGAGMLKGFRPDRVILSCGDSKIETQDVYIAASKQPIQGDYQALLNPSLLDPAEIQGKECRKQ